MSEFDELADGVVVDRDQADPSDTLTGDNTQDPLDAGYRPPEQEQTSWRGDTADEALHGQPLEDKLAEERPEFSESDLEDTVIEERPDIRDSDLDDKLVEERPDPGESDLEDTLAEERIEISESELDGPGPDPA